MKSTAIERPKETLECLKYEPYNTPQAFVTKEGALFQAPKSSLIPRLRSLGNTPSNSTTENPVHTEKRLSQLIVDLSFITNRVAQRPGAHFDTVRDLCQAVWLDILELAKGFSRVDVVPDDYRNLHPIKANTRSSRGQGTKLSFELNSKITGKLIEFLNNEDNKDCLYTIMTMFFKQIIQASDIPIIFVIVYAEDTIIGSVPKSTHREADYRIVMHVRDAISKGFNDIVVRCNDTDIMIIMIAFMPMFLLASPTINISIKHGLGDGELLNLNNVCANLGVLNCRMTLFMHAFTGCDYTPSFF